MAIDKDGEIASDILAQQIDLFRFGAGERGRVLSILKQMEEDLIDQLLHAKLTDIGRADKAKLLAEAQDVIERYYAQAAALNGESMEEAGRNMALAVQSSMTRAFRGNVEVGLPSETFFRKLVDNTLIEGAVMGDHWRRQAANTAWAYQSAVAQGLAEGETNADIIRRITGRAVGYDVVDGERVYRYAGGVMGVSRKDAATLVQTSVAQAGASARRETYQANGDVIKGIRQVSTLDGHTSLICVAYSGGRWTLDYQPIAPWQLPYNGGTPRHWNCRSVEVPVTKTWRELGVDLPEFVPSQRAASGGPVSGKVEFDDFLNLRGKKFTDDLLGAGRAELWRDGTITLQQLLDQSGRPLSVDELRRKYAQ